MKVYSSLSSSELKIRGTFHMQGPQVTGDNGNAPRWLEKVFEDNPKINIIAISGDTFGQVYQRND